MVMFARVAVMSETTQSAEFAPKLAPNVTVQPVAPVAVTRPDESVDPVASVPVPQDDSAGAVLPTPIVRCPCRRLLRNDDSIVVVSWAYTSDTAQSPHTIPTRNQRIRPPPARPTAPAAPRSRSAC